MSTKKVIKEVKQTAQDKLLVINGRCDALVKVVESLRKEGEVLVNSLLETSDKKEFMAMQGRTMIRLEEINNSLLSMTASGGDSDDDETTSTSSNDEPATAPVQLQQSGFPPSIPPSAVRYSSEWSPGRAGPSRFKPTSITSPPVRPVATKSSPLLIQERSLDVVTNTEHNYRGGEMSDQSRSVRMSSQSGTAAIQMPRPKVPGIAQGIALSPQKERSSSVESIHRAESLTSLSRAYELSAAAPEFIPPDSRSSSSNNTDRASFSDSQSGSRSDSVRLHQGNGDFRLPSFENKSESMESLKQNYPRGPDTVRLSYKDLTEATKAERIAVVTAAQRSVLSSSNESGPVGTCSIESPAFELKINEWYKVYVSDISHPTYFFARAWETSNQLNELVERMQGYYAKKDAARTLGQAPEVGLYCTSRFKFGGDSGWYRAIIQEQWEVEGGDSMHVCVLYIDYGNHESQPWTELRPLPEQFKHLPQQATSMALSYVAPIVGHMWSQEAIDFMADLNTGVTPMQIKLVHDSIADWLFVDLKVEGDNETVNDKLLKKGFARPATNIELRKMFDLEYTPTEADFELDPRAYQQEMTRNRALDSSYIAANFLSKTGETRDSPLRIGNVDSDRTASRSQWMPQSDAHAQNIVQSSDFAIPSCNLQPLNRSPPLPRYLNQSQPSYIQPFRQPQPRTQPIAGGDLRDSCDSSLRMSQDSLDQRTVESSVSASPASAASDRRARDVTLHSAAVTSQNSNNCLPLLMSTPTGHLHQKINPDHDLPTVLPLAYQPLPSKQKSAPAKTVDITALASTAHEESSSTSVSESSNKPDNLHSTPVKGAGTVTRSMSPDLNDTDPGVRSDMNLTPDQWEELAQENYADDEADLSLPAADSGTSMVDNSLSVNDSTLKTLGSGTVNEIFSPDPAFPEEVSSSPVDGALETKSLTLRLGYKAEELTQRDITIKTGYIKCMLAHVDTIWDFYVHLCDTETADTLALIRDHLLTVEKSAVLYSRFYASTEYTEGMLVCARWNSDGNNYRACVRSHRSERDGSPPTEYLVFFLDYGNSEWLKREDIFPLSPHLQQYPAQAIRCSAAHIKPVTDGRDRSQWSEEVINEFENLCQYNNLLYGYIFNRQEYDDSIITEPLQLVLMDPIKSPKCKWLNTVMVINGWAEVDHAHLQHTVDDEENQTIEKWNPMMNDYLSTYNTHQVDVNEPEIYLTGHRPQASEQICTFHNTAGGCWKGTTCDFRHVNHPRREVALSREVWCPKETENISCPDVNAWVSLKITSICHPGRFFAFLPHGNRIVKPQDGQLTTDSSLDDGYCSPGEETLQLLQLSLNEEYNKRIATRDRDLVDLAPCELVAALSRNDVWYRAKVLESDEDEIHVYFVDFGNSERVNEERIRTIDQHFLHLPFQAVECMLADVRPVGGFWSPHSLEYFHKLGDGQVLFAHVVARNGPGRIEVDLYNTSSSEDVHINYELIKMGFAQRLDSQANNNLPIAKPGSASLKPG